MDIFERNQPRRLALAEAIKKAEIELELTDQVRIVFIKGSVMVLEFCTNRLTAHIYKFLAFDIINLETTLLRLLLGNKGLFLFVLQLLQFC